MNTVLQNIGGLAAKHLPTNGENARQINAAGMAELVDARDLKCLAPAGNTKFFLKIASAAPIETDGTKHDLQNSQR